MTVFSPLGKFENVHESGPELNDSTIPKPMSKRNCESCDSEVSPETTPATDREYCPNCGHIFGPSIVTEDELTGETVVDPDLAGGDDK